MNLFLGCLFFAVLLLGALGQSTLRQVAWHMTLEESLDHPSRRTRYWYRFWIGCFCYTASVFLTFILLAGVLKLLDFRPAKVSAEASLVPWLLLFASPIPLAMLLMWAFRRIALSGDRRKRSGRRKLGLPGYTIVPPELAQAQARARLATAAPAAASARARSGMDEVLETGDPELVREVARKHWEALHLAIASRGDQAAALDLQEAFLEKLDGITDANLRNELFDSYAKESHRQARVASALMERQIEIKQGQAALRHRVMRNGSIFIVICIAGWIALLLLKLLR